MKYLAHLVKLLWKKMKTVMYFVLTLILIDFYQPMFVFGLETLHVHRLRLLTLILMTVVMIVNSNFLFQLKKMIQIVCCSCTQWKLKGEEVDFYSEKKFYDNIDKIYVVPCPRHPYFKERIGSRFVNISCNCLNLEEGRCNSCKVICFNLNLLEDKIKVGRYIDIPSDIEMVMIEQYLMNMKSMLFFYFCRGCYKVQCSFDNPKYICLIKKKTPKKPKNSYEFDL